MMIASLAVDGAGARYDKAYSYAVPEGMAATLRPGCRVRVPFGAGGHSRRALVLGLAEGEAGAGMKAVAEQTDAEPVIGAEGFALLDYLRTQTFCGAFEALSALIPPGIGLPPRRAGALWIAPAGGEPPEKLTPKQSALFALLLREGDLPLGDAMALADVGRSVADKLAALGAAVIYRRPDPPEPPAEAPPQPPPVLSPAQQQAADTLLALASRGAAETALLYGVTGSGKTSVYLRLIHAVTAGGRGAIVLVPEIGLTPQTAALFAAQFGGRLAVMHSALSPAERAEAYRRIRRGEVSVVVGTRSAVFAPLENIGLIVVDEEQEATYHAESAPRYHAREVAAFRCRRHGALLLLASATPSVESYAAAERGRIHRVALTERFSGGALPEVRAVDLRFEPLAGESTCITEALAGELAENLARGEQSILLLNRRGYHTLVKCSACGEAVKCPHCEVTMTYHAVGQKLMCHYCGFQRPVQGACDVCGSELIRYTGLGTQRAAEELSALFPQARVLRMDADTTGSRFAHRNAFRAFADGRYDIMLGTQMVAKGLNFPRVTLVGVLLADQSFYTDDFRSYEKSFALITQAVGRCGRGALPGRALIQTYTPENRVIPLAAAQDYPGFFEEEFSFRRAGLYPPFCDLMLVGFTGEEQARVEAAARRFADMLAALAAERYPDLPLRALGPAPFAVPKVAGRWRSRLLLKCRRTARLGELVSALQAEFFADSRHKGVHCYVDPYCDRL